MFYLGSKDYTVLEFTSFNYAFASRSSICLFIAVITLSNIMQYYNATILRKPNEFLFDLMLQ